MPGWLIDAVGEFDVHRAQAVLDSLVSEPALLAEWHLERLPGTGGGSFGSAVFRVTLLYSPTGSDDGEIDCVTAILKITMRVNLDPSLGSELSTHTSDLRSHTSDLRYASREIEFYRALSGPDFLTMPDGLRVPDLYLSWVTDTAVGIVIEDVGSPYPGTIEQVARLAKRLGELNATSIEPPEWFSRDGLQQEHRLLAGRLPQAIDRLGSENFQRVFVRDRQQQLLRIHHATPALLRRLDSLPQGFAHLDPFSRNCIWETAPEGDVSVLFDWAGVGIAPIGSDVGSLTWLTAAYLDVDADELSSLDDAVFCAYVEGLAKGGFGGSVADVRTAYVGTTLLRATAMMSNVAPLLATDHETIATTIGRPLEEIVDGWVALRPFLESRIVEALAPAM